MIYICVYVCLIYLLTYGSHCFHVCVKEKQLVFDKEYLAVTLKWGGGL